MAEIEDARLAWKSACRGDGAVCPVCDRWGAYYERPINENQGMALAWLYIEQTKTHRGTGVGWVDVPRSKNASVLRSNQHPTLKYWKLVHSREDESGLWRVTDLGIAFLKGEVTVPKYVLLYHDQVIGESSERIYFRQINWKRKAYDQVMAPLKEHWNKKVAA